MPNALFIDLLDSETFTTRQALVDIVVSCDHNSSMKTAGVRELKAKLSDYLRQVARGEIILVTDRGHVVAEIRPPGVEQAALTPADLRFRQAVDRGLIRASSLPVDQKKQALERLLKGAPGPMLAKGTAAQILDDLRGESL